MWAERYTKSASDSIDSHTDMLRIMRSSPGNARMDVALPSSVWRRQTNPEVASARALIGSRLAMNSAVAGSSTGARSRPMFS